MLRIHHGEIPQRRDDEGRQKHEKAHKAQIRSHQGRKIIVVRLLDEIEKGRGQDHHRGGVVHHQNDAPLHDGGCCGVRPLRVAHPGKGVEPLGPVHGLGDALLTHGHGVDVDAGQALADLPQGLPVHLVVEIAQNHVRFRAHAHLVVLHHQLRIADAPADQGGVLLDDLGEAVVGAAQHLAVGGLRHAPGRVGLGVEQQRPVHPVDEQHALAQQRGGDDGLHVVFRSRFPIGGEAAGELIHVRRGFHLLRRQRQEYGQDPLDHRVLAVAVEKIEMGVPAADEERPLRNIVIAPHTQDVGQYGHIGAEGPCQSFHKSPSFRRMVLV